MENTGDRVGNMRLNRAELEVFHKGFSCFSAAFDAEGDNAAGAVRHHLFGDFVVFVAGQAGVGNPGDLLVVMQEFRDLLCVGDITGHADSQAFQAEVEQVSVVGRLDRTKVTHQLCGSLGDECAFFSETLCIDNAVVALVGSGQAGELVSMGHPVELARVNDCTADGGRVAVDILGSRMGDDISAPFNRAAVDGGGEGIVDDQRDAVFMGNLCKERDIEDSQGRVGDGFTKDSLGVGLESGSQFFLGAVGGNEGKLNAHLLHRDSKQVEGAAIDGGCGDNMIAAVCDIENCVEVGSLTGRGQHACGTALKSSDFCCNVVIGRVLETGIEVAVCFEVKQLAHFLTGFIGEGSRLNDRYLSGFTGFGNIAGMKAFGFEFHCKTSFLFVYGYMARQHGRCCRTDRK